MYPLGVLLTVNIFRIGFRSVNMTTGPSSAVNATAVFIGDSLTQWFRRDGRKTWDKYYGSIDCKNFGVAGEQTSQTIDRLNSGMLNGIATAKVSVILIGTNDIGWGKDEVYIASQIEKIVSRVRILLPGVKVLLLGILPRGTLIRPNSDKSVKINAIISKLDDGNEVRFLDMGSRFSSKDGKVAKELYTDGLHLSAEGYKAWAETMNPLFNEMIKS